MTPGRSPTPTPLASTSTTDLAPEAILARIRVLLDQLSTLATPARVPGLQLSPADCDRIEETTGFASTRSAEELVKAIERLASIKIGDIRIPFSPGQIAELQHRAQKRGRTLDAELRAVVSRIEDELFYRPAHAG